MCIDKKILYNITKFTALDWEEHLSAVFWFPSCNMRCPYCHNPDIVYGKANITKKEALEFLKTRIGKLEAVVFSGGECTLFKDLPNFIKDVKELGFLVKIDTNGTNPKMIEELVEKELVDFISLDFKAPKEKYQKITKDKNYENFLETLKILIEKDANFELRTTVHTDLLDENDINNIIQTLKDLGFDKRYYIQNYHHQDVTLSDMPPQKKVLDIDKIDIKTLSVNFRNF